MGTTSLFPPSCSSLPLAPSRFMASLPLPSRSLPLFHNPSDSLYEEDDEDRRRRKGCEEDCRVPQIITMRGHVLGCDVKMPGGLSVVCQHHVRRGIPGRQSPGMHVPLNFSSDQPTSLPQKFPQKVTQSNNMMVWYFCSCCLSAPPLPLPPGGHQRTANTIANSTHYCRSHRRCYIRCCCFCCC